MVTGKPVNVSTGHTNCVTWNVGLRARIMSYIDHRRYV